MSYKFQKSSVRRQKRRQYNQRQYAKRIRIAETNNILDSRIIKELLKKRKDRLRQRKIMLQKVENILSRYRKICYQFETKYEGAVTEFLKAQNRNVDILLEEFSRNPQTNEDFEILEFADLMFEYLTINIDNIILHKIDSFTCIGIIIEKKEELIPFAKSSTWSHFYENYYRHFYESAFLATVETVVDEAAILSHHTYNNYTASNETREVEVQYVLKGFRIYHNAKVKVFLGSFSLMAKVMTECGIDVKTFECIQTTAHAKKERGCRDLRHFFQLNGYDEEIIPTLAKSLYKGNTRQLVTK